MYADKRFEIETQPDQRTEIIRKWVEALRSGEYKQCTGWYHFSGSGAYCVLGVLGVVAGMDVRALGVSIGSKIDQAAFTAPFEHLIGHKLALDVLCLNDLRGYRFTALADFIEQGREL